MISCIFAVSHLKTTIIFSEFVGEEVPGLLLISPIPLSVIIMELVKSIVLLAGGFTLLIKKAITLRLYHFYCIFIIAEGFIFPFNGEFLFLNGLYFFISIATVISVVLLIYFNSRKVVQEINPKKRISITEHIIYVILCFAIIFLAYFLRSIFFEQYELSIFN